MDLINLALKYRDYEWVKKLLAVERSEEHVETSEKASDYTSVEKGRGESFNEESIALETITNTYAVREKNGLRAFNINSEYDRNMSELVLVEKPSYRKGETVKYRSPSNEELIFARGMVNGYIMGYGEANNNLNSQLMEYFTAIETHESKRQTAGSRKSAKARKNKMPKNVA